MRGHATRPALGSAGCRTPSRSRRLAALPVLLVVLIREEGPTSVPRGRDLRASSAVTDFLDGYLARRLGAESRFGRIADPLADRLLVGVGLVGRDRCSAGSPPAAPVILIVRDVAIVVGVACLLRRGDRDARGHGRQDLVGADHDRHRRARSWLRPGLGGRR